MKKLQTVRGRQISSYLWQQSLPWIFFFGWWQPWGWAAIDKPWIFFLELVAILPVSQSRWLNIAHN
jgi:dipeptidyl aminopeptidase/acylaminoacyl peptidase